MRNANSFRARLQVECLEDRTAPATLVSPTTVTYQDADGDQVRVSFSKPLLSAVNVNSVLTFNAGAVDGDNTTPQQLRAIDLTSVYSTAAGTSITLTAAPSAISGGDGLAPVGNIDAAGIDLGTVTIDGDLGQIAAGDDTLRTVGLKGLTAQSIGAYSTVTGATDLFTRIHGRLGFLTVKSDIWRATIEVVGGTDGRIGRVAIGGSLIGGTADSSGRIRADGTIGPVHIAKSMIGSSGAWTGQIEAAAGLGPVRIGGSLQGGAGSDSGQLVSNGPMGFVRIGGDVIGGTGVDSGTVFCSSTSPDAPCTVAGVTIGGSVRGIAAGSGRVFALRALGPVWIGGDVIGGPTQQGVSAFSGQIASFGDIGLVTIMGDLIGGYSSDSGAVVAGARLIGARVGGSVKGGVGNFSGRISATRMGPVVIGGNLGGNYALESGTVHSVAELSSVRVGGNVAGGGGAFSGRISSDGNMGPVTVLGDVIGGSAHDSGTVYSARRLARIKIDGSVRGLGGDRTGRIFAGADMGPVTILGSLTGGKGSQSGEVYSSAGLARVTVRGSVDAVRGGYSGRIISEMDMGPVTIGQDMSEYANVTAKGKLARITVGGSVQGGFIQSGDDIGLVAIRGDLVGTKLRSSGSVTSGARLTVVRVGGSVLGGEGLYSGLISAVGEIGTVDIGGNLVGGRALGSPLFGSGSVSAKRIGRLTLGGSLIAGVGIQSPTYLDNGAIRVEDDLGTVLIKGNVIGNPMNPAVIAARGSRSPTATADVAIGSLRVLGKIEFGRILAGYYSDGRGVNADAQIGKVTIGGDWVGSCIAAGATPGANGAFGDDDDAKLSGVRDESRVSSRIGQVTIGGQVLPANAGPAHTGIVAEHVVAVTVGGKSLALSAGIGNDDVPAGDNGDFRINEI